MKLKISVLVMIVILIFTSCTESKKNSINIHHFHHKEYGYIKIGQHIYIVNIISGVEKAFDAIRTSQNEILISLYGSRKILKFNSDYEFIQWIGVNENDEFSTSWEKPDNFPDKKPDSSQYSGPHSFVSDPRTPHEFVTVFYGKKTTKNGNTLARYDLTSGHFKGNFGLVTESDFSKGYTSEYKITMGTKNFTGLVNAIYDSSYNLYLSDYSSCSISKFNSQYKFIGWIGAKDDDSLTSGWNKKGNPGCSNLPGGFNRQHGIAIDSQKNIYIADTWNNRIQKFDQNGIFIGWIGVKENGSLTHGWETKGNAIASDIPGGFNTPIAIRIDRHDNLYVLEWRGNRLQKLGHDNKQEWSLGGFSAAYGLQVSMDAKEIIVSDTGNKRIVIFTRK